MRSLFFDGIGKMDTRSGPKVIMDFLQKIQNQIVVEVFHG